jgi:hypothetical protein
MVALAVLAGCSQGATPDAAPPAGDPASDTPTAPDPAAEPSPAPAPDAEPQQVVWLERTLDLPASWTVTELDDARLELLITPTAPDGDALRVSLLRDTSDLLAIVDRETASDDPAELTDTEVTLAGDVTAVQLERERSILLVTDRGLIIEISLVDQPSTTVALARLRRSLDDIVALLARLDLPLTDGPPTPSPEPPSSAAPAPTPPSGAAPAPAPRPAQVRRTTIFGAPFPADVPVAMVSGPTLVLVDDSPKPQDRCTNNGRIVACTDPIYGWESNLKRTWSYRIASESAMLDTCRAYLDRLLSAGLAFGQYDDAGRQCVIDAAHGYRMAYIYGELPDGSRVRVQLRNDDPIVRGLVSCGTPCTTINVSVAFPATRISERLATEHRDALEPAPVQNEGKESEASTPEASTPEASTPEASTPKGTKVSKGKKAPVVEPTPAQLRDRALLTLHESFQNFRVWHTSGLHPCGEAAEGVEGWTP